jgi:hypothetical protein
MTEATPRKVAGYVPMPAAAYWLHPTDHIPPPNLYGLTTLDRIELGLLQRQGMTQGG